MQEKSFFNIIFIPEDPPGKFEANNHINEMTLNA